MNKKRLGLILTLISLVFFFVGITEYLFNSTLFIGSIHGDDYSSIWRIKDGKDSYLSYNVTLKKVELNFSLTFSFEVESKQLIDFYTMSSSQFFAWRNNSELHYSLARTNVSDEQVSFSPTNNDTYYFVLDNSAYNSTKTVAVKSSWGAAVYLIDYSKVTGWLITASIGTVLFFIGCVLSGNPVNRVFRKIREASRFPSIVEQEDPSISHTVTKHSLRMLWIAIIVPTGLLSAILLSKIPDLWEIPAEFSPVVLDLLLRIFLFYFFGLVLPIAFCFMLGILFFTVVSDFDSWILIKRGISPRNPKLQPLVWKYLRTHLASRQSFLSYLSAIFLFAVGYFLQDNGFPLYMVGATVLAIPLGQSVFISSKEACTDLKLKWECTLKQSRVYTLNSMVVALWVLVGVLILIKILVSLGILLGYGYFLESSPYPLKTEIFSSTPSISKANQLIEATFSTAFLGAVIFFAVFISIEYHLLPLLASKKKKKLESLIFPIVVAFISTATGSVLVSIVSPQSLSNPYIQFLLPISTFIAGYAAEKAFEELIPEVLTEEQPQ